MGVSAWHLPTPAPAVLLTAALVAPLHAQTEAPDSLLKPGAIVRARHCLVFCQTLAVGQLARVRQGALVFVSGQTVPFSHVSSLQVAVGADNRALHVFKNAGAWAAVGVLLSVPVSIALASIFPKYKDTSCVLIQCSGSALMWDRFVRPGLVLGAGLGATGGAIAAWRRPGHIWRDVALPSLAGGTSIGIARNTPSRLDLGVRLTLPQRRGQQ